MKIRVELKVTQEVRTRPTMCVGTESHKETTFIVSGR